jgi:hypothetical protein
MLQKYVSIVSDVSEGYVVKIDCDVAHVAMVVHAYCKRPF